MGKSHAAKAGASLKDLDILAVKCFTVKVLAHALQELQFALIQHDRSDITLH
jgi:hypothetical protein